MIPFAKHSEDASPGGGDGAAAIVFVINIFVSLTL